MTSVKQKYGSFDAMLKYSTLQLSPLPPSVYYFVLKAEHVLTNTNNMTNKTGQNLTAVTFFSTFFPFHLFKLIWKIYIQKT